MDDQHWAHAESGPVHDLFSDRLVAFLANEPDGTTAILGSGILLFAAEGVGVVATAAHVLDFAARVQGIRGSQEPDARPELDLSRERFRILWVGRTSVHALVSTGMTVRSNHADVGLLFVSFQDADSSNWELPAAGYAFDHRLPGVGSELVVVGQTLEVGYQVVQGTARSFQVTREIVVRKGSVLAVDPRGSYMGIGPNFTTTIPFPPGFSGSPVIDLGVAGDLVTLRGLVSSSGFPEVGADSDTRLSGEGRCVSVLPLMRLPVDADRRFSLADLVRRGHFMDKSGELAQDPTGDSGPVTELRMWPSDLGRSES